MSMDLVGIGGKVKMYKGGTENIQEYFPNLLEHLFQILYSILVIQTCISKCGWYECFKAWAYCFWNKWKFVFHFCWKQS